MHKITKTAAAVVPVVMAGSTLLAVPSAQAVGSPGCVTRAEMSHVHRGQTVKKVRHILGAHGRTSFVYEGTYVFDKDIKFKPCYPYGRYSFAEVSFGKKHAGGTYRVDGKTAWWIHN